MIKGQVKHSEETLQFYQERVARLRADVERHREAHQKSGEQDECHTLSCAHSPTLPSSTCLLSWLTFTMQDSSVALLSAEEVVLAQTREASKMSQQYEKTLSGMRDELRLCRSRMEQAG